MNQQEKDALFKWMQEVTSLLCYQPEVPMTHKEDLCTALNDYSRVSEASKVSKIKK